MKSVSHHEYSCHPLAVKQYQIALQFQNGALEYMQYHFQNLPNHHQFSFVKAEKQLYFFSDFAENLYLNATLEQQKSAKVIYTTVRLDDNQIQLISWFSLFKFIHRFHSSFNHGAAFDVISELLDQHICQSLFSKNKLTKKDYFKLCNVSENTFIKQKKLAIKPKTKLIITPEALR